MAAAIKTDPYHFDPRFERAVVYLTCAHPRFFGRVGHTLDPALLADPSAKLAVEAAQASAKDAGHGPSDPTVVIQRLRRWCHDGRVTLEQVQAVADLLDDVEDRGVPPEEDVISEVVPVLRRRMENVAVMQALDTYGKRGDFKAVVDLVERAERLGRQDASIGIRIGASSFDALSRGRTLTRLPTGVQELDLALEGGLPRGAIGLVMGGAGGCKSMFLSHLAASCLTSGLHVALATLELPEAEVLARIKANILGRPIKQLLEGETGAARAEFAAIPLGPGVVKEFTPMVTTPDEIREWVQLCGEQVGRPVDVLVIDYADRMTAVGAEKKGSHDRTLDVYNALDVLADERDLWLWTASQPRGREDRKAKVLDLEHVADSVHKVRIADLVVTLNEREEEQMVYYVAKNRHGPSKRSVGPLPMDLACGQMSPIPRRRR